MEDTLFSKRHYKDTKFDYNYEECKKLGIKVGIYYQGAATSYDDGRSDAQQVLQWMTGKSCEIGIFNQIDISKFNNSKVIFQKNYLFAVSAIL